jgi:hypothetical protein
MIAGSHGALVFSLELGGVFRRAGSRRGIDFLCRTGRGRDDGRFLGGGGEGQQTADQDGRWYVCLDIFHDNHLI